MSLNSANDTMTVSGIDRSHIGNYTVTILGQRITSPTYSESKTFMVFVMDEDPPTSNEVDDMVFHGNRTSSLSLSNGPFDWPNGYPGTIQLTTSPSVGWITYDESTNQITVISGSGDDGTFDVILTADDHNPDTSNETNTFQVGKYRCLSNSCESELSSFHITSFRIYI